MKGTYEDIIERERPVSKKHRPMPAANRAAQFSPFAALSGYDDAIRETDRQTEEKRDLSEDMLAALNERLRHLEEQEKKRPFLRLTYFLRDEKKEGGGYVTRRGRFRRVDREGKTLVLADGGRIPLGDVFWLEEEPEE